MDMDLSPEGTPRQSPFRKVSITESDELYIRIIPHHLTLIIMPINRSHQINTETKLISCR